MFQKISFIMGLKRGIGFMKHKHLGCILLFLFLLFNDKTEMAFSWSDTWMMELIIVGIGACVVFIGLKNIDKLKAE